MLNITKHVSTILLTTIAVTIGALAFASSAHAHTIYPGKCEIVWQNAPAGHKWEAKVRCLKFMKKHNQAHMCQRPRFAPATTTVKHERADGEQRRVLSWIMNEGHRRHLRRVAVLAAVVATTQEAEARELAGGDGTSVGPFQLISTHGSAADRQTVEFSGNWFYNGAVDVLRGHSGISAPDLAQAVERSAYPHAYAQWLGEARWTLKRFSGPCILYRR
jgi:hypothetical protein